MFGRRIFIDIYISMFMALTLLFFALAERYPERRRLFLLLMYACVGLGVLTKGPVAAALPGLVFARLSAGARRAQAHARDDDSGRRSSSCSRSSSPGTRRSISGTAGPTSRRSSVGENIARYTEGSASSSRRGPLFYLPVVFSDSFPWSLCLFGAAGCGWSTGARCANGGVRRRAIAASGSARCCGCGSSVIVGFFSFSAAKQDSTSFRSCRPSPRWRACSSHARRPAAARVAPGAPRRRRP